MQDFVLQPTDPAAWALFLDIDGTLLDLASTPEGVIVPPSLPALLHVLTDRLSGALALISGRDLTGIDRLFPGGCDAAGCHGAEWRRGGKIFAVAEAMPEALVATISAAVGHLPGVRAEAKTRSLALHFRCGPESGHAVRSLAETAIRGAGARLCLLEGKSVIEILPCGATKGDAIDRFMRSPPYAGRRPVFVGDDVTDESGFTAVNRAGGHSIHVGDAPETAARFRFPSPAALRHWLASLDRSLKDTSGHEHA